ncbi:MAG: FGGY-family carbohydrate kinase, partial [Hoeflea sp.]|nr:FGGY-family carbohydrate kinase [Hoeflea sp.]
QVLEDENGTVIRPAILWNDQRSSAQTQALRDRADARILMLAGNRANPTWTLPQMLWLRENEPDSFARVKRLYLAKDWIRSRFTGDWMTDRIDAVGTLMSVADGSSWSEELCDMIGWKVEALPPIAPSTFRAGTVSAQASGETGLAAGTPVIVGASDTAVETYGAGLTEPGLGVIKLATAATVAVLSREPHAGNTVINYPHVMPDHYYVITGTNSCASAHRWLRDTFFMSEGQDGSAAFERMEILASSVSPGSEGLFFHPYLNGERSPHWDPLLRAEFVGIGFQHGPGHFVRALYEGVAFSLRDCRDALVGQGLDFSTARLIGGGTRSSLWCQIVADVLGVEVELPGNGDASFGAALLAGVGAGVFADEAAAAKAAIRVSRRIEPNLDNAAFYTEAHGIYVDIHEALAPIHHRIARMYANNGASPLKRE